MIISYIIAVVLRLIPFLVLGSLPYYDPWAYYLGVVSYTTGNDFVRQGVFKQGHIGFYSLILVVYSLTELPLLPYLLLFPPLFNSLSILPMYLLVREFFKNEKTAVISVFFFSIMEIIVLRQSYLVPEGFAIYLMLLIFFYVFKDPRTRFLNQAFICFTLFYCLCSMHNLTSSMTLIPLLFTLFCLVVQRMFKKQVGELLQVSQSLRFIIISIGLSLTWIFWAKEYDYSGFIGEFLRLNILAIFLSLSGRSTPTPEGFTEHYITTQESSSLTDLVVMNAGSLMVTFLGFISFFTLLKKPRKEMSHIFLIFWSISMFFNFALNIVIDSIFIGRTYAQQAYRAWIFFIIPVIIIASLRINEIQNNKVLYILMTTSLIFCLFGAVWFNIFLMETFPHIKYT